MTRLKLVRWYNELHLFAPVRFKTVIDTVTTHSDTIVNYSNDRPTNASTESFNAKIKDLRRQYRGFNDTVFFLFRLSTLYGCHHTHQPEKSTDPERSHQKYAQTHQTSFFYFILNLFWYYIGTIYICNI